MKQCNLDERQLWLRGEVFKHSLILMGFLLLLNTFLTDSGIILINGIYANIMIVALTASFANIEMALKGAVNYDDNRNLLLSVIMGVCGLIVLVLNIIHIIGGESLVEKGQLTEDGTFLIMSISFIAIPIVYFFKHQHYRKSIND